MDQGRALKVNPTSVDQQFHLFVEFNLFFPETSAFIATGPFSFRPQLLPLGDFVDACEFNGTRQYFTLPEYSSNLTNLEVVSCPEWTLGLFLFFTINVAIKCVQHVMQQPPRVQAAAPRA